MKALLILFFSLLIFLSCQNTGKSQVADLEDVEEAVDTIPKATAIFWVDKAKDNKKKGTPTPIRTVKAKVDVDSLGKVEVLSYVKPQSARVKEYLQYRLEIFRVKKVMLDSGYVKPGVQYVQLRYVPDNIKKHIN
ncbi:DUF4891 domain-containing protein [Bacteroides sp.]|uniref:DUF4891 domain-containing protein n=1 Tax=Bacteroides sp. TaxID=29523 RepID=UPI003AB1DF5C